MKRTISVGTWSESLADFLNILFRLHCAVLPHSAALLDVFCCFHRNLVQLLDVLSCFHRYLAQLLDVFSCFHRNLVQLLVIFSCFHRNLVQLLDVFCCFHRYLVLDVADTESQNLIQYFPRVCTPGRQSSYLWFNVSFTESGWPRSKATITSSSWC